tara:strand:+ start:966 stop:2744 length:1779 start_codon:yes stop_codon:yes gene_type:complete
MKLLNFNSKKRLSLLAFLISFNFSYGQNGSASITITHIPGKTMINGESKWDIPEWQRAETQSSNCFSFLGLSVFVKSEYGGAELKYKLEVTNNAPYTLDITSSKWGFGSGGRTSIKPGSSTSGSGSFKLKDGERTITFSNLQFVFPKSDQEKYNISPLSAYLACGEDANTALEKAKSRNNYASKVSETGEGEASESGSAESANNNEQDALGNLTQQVMGGGTFSNNPKPKKTTAEIHAEHVAANNARVKSSGSSSTSNKGNSSSTRGKTASGPSQEEIERQRKADEYARAQAKQAEENRQRQEYAQWKNQQNQRNAQIAAATAVGTVSMLAILGKMIYQNMGMVDLNDVYQNKPSLSMAVEFGYSFMIQPIYFNSEVYNGVDFSYNTDYDFTWPVNFDFKFKLGYESEYVGAYGFGGIGLGASVIMHSFNAPTYNYGAQVYAGHPNFKALFEYQGGGRAISQNYWLLEEESGSAYSSINYSQIRYGARFTWGKFTRSHLSLGLINEGITGNDDTQVQRIELPEAYNIEDRFVTGYFIEYKKDHSFNFFLNLYPNYPFTGEVEHSFRNTSDANYDDGSLYFLVGFHRSLDFFL